MSFSCLRTLPINRLNELISASHCIVETSRLSSPSKVSHMIHTDTRNETQSREWYEQATASTADAAYMTSSETIIEGQPRKPRLT